jgi:hypothetical protein
MFIFIIFLITIFFIYIEQGGAVVERARLADGQ